MMEMMKMMEIQQDTFKTFNPYYNSIPGPSGNQYKMTTANREGEKTPDITKVSESLLKHDEA